MAAQVIIPAAQRDGGLDLLCGLMPGAMAINHITSHLQVLTDHPLGYTSSAEGFVFLSGLVAGLVYARRFRRQGPVAVVQAARARPAMLYLGRLALFAVARWRESAAKRSSLRQPGPPALQRARHRLGT